LYAKCWLTHFPLHGTVATSSRNALEREHSAPASITKRVIRNSSSRDGCTLGGPTGLTAVDVTNDWQRDIIVGSPNASSGGRVDVLPMTYFGGLTGSGKYFFQQPTIL